MAQRVNLGTTGLPVRKKTFIAKTVSAVFSLKQEVFLQDTNEVFLILLTITHDDIDPSIRVVNNNEAITSNGNLFTAFPFNIELPDSRENAVPRARLSIDNVSREIAEAIRTITTVATITIEIIRAADPDTIEITWAPFNLRNVTWDMTKVSGDLVSEEIEMEPFPIGQFTPANSPGLF